MTTGQLLFYAGAGLLLATVILAVVFAKKKPQYRPENAAVFESQTVPLRNGYPTEPVTVRRESEKKSVSIKIQQEKEPESTPAVPATVLPDQNTAPLQEDERGTVPLEAGERFSRKTDALTEKTERLHTETELLETEILTK